MKFETLPVIKDNEGLIIICDTDRPFDEARDMYNGIAAQYPKHPVICIPENYDIQIKDIDSMIEYLKNFKKELKL